MLASKTHYPGASSVTAHANTTNGDPVPAHDPHEHTHRDRLTCTPCLYVLPITIIALLGLGSRH